jgi:hypothetical protein
MSNSILLNRAALEKLELLELLPPLPMQFTTQRARESEVSDYARQNYDVLGLGSGQKVAD